MIRKFNEFMIDKEFEELKEFCQECCIDIIDNNFKLQFNQREEHIDIYFTRLFQTLLGFKPISFTFNQVEDSFYKLVELLSDDYKIDISFRLVNSKNEIKYNNQDTKQESEIKYRKISYIKITIYR